jgi:predicted NodU family carbamoyl transferase
VAKPVRTILGINPGYHDSAAAILRDGRVIAVVETERLSRTKHALMESPAAAVKECLAMTAMTLKDVDHIALGWSPPFAPDRESDSLLDPAALATYQQRVLQYALSGEGDWSEIRTASPAYSGTSSLRLPPSFSFHRHHIAHAASLRLHYANDPLTTIVVDGQGERESTTVGQLRGTDFLSHAAHPIAHSIGNFYGHAARWAGLGFHGGGQLMGLAAYYAATPAQLSHELPAFDGSDYRGQREKHRAHVEAQLAEVFPFSPNEGCDQLAYAQVAAAAQAAVERALFQLAHDHLPANEPALGLVGGVAQNSVALGRLHEVTTPLAGPLVDDAGTAVGAAVLAAHKLAGPVRSDPSPYLGRRWTARELDEATQRIDSNEAVVETGSAEHLTELAVQLLVGGAILGVFRGRAEVGKRALGNRSILASPIHRSSLTRVNEVKGRQPWRPLAPSTLERSVPLIFDVKQATPTMRYMLSTHTVRDSWRKRIPAAVHVDGTARLQSVSASLNPAFHSLLERFDAITSVPALLNTSFNGRGEPIVHTPVQAVNLMLKTEMDGILFDDRILIRRAKR